LTQRAEPRAETHPARFFWKNSSGFEKIADERVAIAHHGPGDVKR
jgi:hypothetical protein